MARENVTHPAEVDPRRWIVLGLIVMAQFMVVLDVAIVNVALPSIKTSLHFSQVNLQWVITAYSILFGGVLMLGGRLSDLLGRRRLFAIGLALFTVSSLLDGLAWSEASLIAFRALQGLGAAFVAPAALSILTTTFQEGRERNIALGIWGAVAGSGGAVGVLLGGVLTSGLGWSWIFFVNVPVGIAVLAATPFLLRESVAGLGHRHFDFAGAAAITAGLMLLVYAMTRAAEHGWGSTESIGLIALAVALIAGFFVIESRSQAPLLPLRIFRLRTLSGSNLGGLLLGASIFAQFFVLTLYMQQVLHYSALTAGFAYIGLALTIVLCSGIAQALTTRLGVATVMPAGMLIAAGALVWLAQVPVHGDYWTNLFGPFLLGGLGLALAFVPMSIGGLTGVRGNDAGVASGLLNTVQQIGGAIGVAIATTVATTLTNDYASSHHTSTTAGPALVHGFQAAFYVLAGIAALGTVLSAILLERRPGAASAERLAEEPALAQAEPA
jgi:EmrB/QacA subfamily drug resistance transporter